MRALLLVLLVACTPAATTVTPSHPAHPDAEPGRLAGPPAALRRGVVEAEQAPPAAADEHAGHQMPSSPLPADMKSPPQAPELGDDMKPPPDSPDGAKSPAEAKKPPKAKKPPAKKPAPQAPVQPPPADPHQGHHGH